MFDMTLFPKYNGFCIIFVVRLSSLKLFEIDTFDSNLIVNLLIHSEILVIVRFNCNSLEYAHKIPQRRENSKMSSVYHKSD